MTQALLLLTSVFAFASGGEHHSNFADLYSSHPSACYSGAVPIDLKNGVLFNNGTYGETNPAIEAWNQAKTIAPGLSELPYPYETKARFINALRFQVEWGEAALANYRQRSDITKPEAAAYSDAAIESLEPILERLKDAVDAAASAGRKDWNEKQEDARRAFINFRMTYTDMHKNHHL